MAINHDVNLLEVTGLQEQNYSVINASIGKFSAREDEDI